MKTFLYTLCMGLLAGMAHAQVTVLLGSDTAKYNLSPARLDAQFMPLDSVLAGATPKQRTDASTAKSNYDRSRFVSLINQGVMPQQGFVYRLTAYFRPNGRAEWVVVEPTGLVPARYVTDLLARLRVFYTETPYPVTASAQFRTQTMTNYGQPMSAQRRQVRTGDSTLSTIEAARATTRPDTVKYLHFHQLELSRIPDVVYRFPNLEELDLSKNGLTQLPAQLITGIPSLRRLSLLFNQIGDDSVAIPKNTHLRALTLQGNQLTRIPAAVRNCKNLESLWLGNSTLTELNVKPLRGLKRLNDLNLYNVGLTALPRQIRKLKHVTVLDLYFNRLTSLPRQLGRMRRLEQLAVSNNALAGFPPQLARLKRLQVLFAHHNQISELPLSLAKLPALHTLDLSYNRLSNVPNFLTGLGTLESVDISNNNIQTLPTTLIDLKNLKKFYIRSNPLTQSDAKTGPYAQLIEALETNQTEVFY